MVGAGFAGLYMLHRLRGMGLSVQVFERGSGVGGTWYWNRYPGARCDSDSVEYSYQFSDELQQEWRWTERYPGQPEILRYLEHVADRFDLRRDIRFETTVTEAVFDEAAGCWRIATEDGANGSPPPIASWPPGVSRPSTGRPSTVWTASKAPGTTPAPGPTRRSPSPANGSASSAPAPPPSSRSPLIAAEAQHLTVFQRQPNYTIPARNGPLDEAEYAAVRANYGELRRRAKQTATGSWWHPNPAAAAEMSAEEREGEMEARWQKGGLSFYGVFDDLLANGEANGIATEFIRGKIRAQVRDPEVADLLSPHSYMGCKRICLDTDYYETFNRPNVSLVDISDAPIEEITRTGLRAGGKEYELDTIVFAIGFDAMTGPLLRVDIRGAGGRSLREKWADGPRTYLGLAIEGFPNLFTDHGAHQPVGAHQHGSHHRAARRVDLRLHRPCARLRPAAHRGDACGGGRLDGTPRGGGGRDALPLLQLVVCGRQCPRQAAHGDALHGRLRDLYREVRRGRRQWLRGILSNYRLSDGLGVA